METLKQIIEEYGYLICPECGKEVLNIEFETSEVFVITSIEECNDHAIYDLINIETNRLN
ncbi:MAG: hypothetical protein ACYDBV_11190 [Nitrospiria bacterium]